MASTRCSRCCSSRSPRQALAHAATVMPGFTHLQTAQPITFGHHCLAYVEMLARDRGRFADARGGSTNARSAPRRLAGTSFPIDRDMTAKALGFARPSANSLDAVSDRDFALEHSLLLRIAAMHLSRLAEEIVLWTSPQFGFVRLSDRYSTGSSIMPQKRNPDAAELVARQDRAHRRRLSRAAHGDEGPAARLRQGHAGGQGAGLRRACRAQARACRHGRHGRRPRAGRARHEEGRRRAATPPPPTSPIGWCASSACPSARPTTSPAASSPLPTPRAATWPKLALDELQIGRSANHQGRILGARCEQIGQKPDVAMGAQPQQMCGGRPKNG